MSYEHELDAWRSAVRGMSEMDRVATQIDVRRAASMASEEIDEQPWND